MLGPLHPWRQESCGVRTHPINCDFRNSFAIDRAVDELANLGIGKRLAPRVHTDVDPRRKIAARRLPEVGIGLNLPQSSRTKPCGVNLTGEEGQCACFAVDHDAEDDPVRAEITTPPVVVLHNSYMLTRNKLVKDVRPRANWGK